MNRFNFTVLIKKEHRLDNGLELGKGFLCGLGANQALEFGGLTDVREFSGQFPFGFNTSVGFGRIYP